MMIKKISVNGVRGFTREVELSPLTLVVGSNESGKSSLLMAATLALTGKLPGGASRAVASNCGESGAMTATVFMDDGKIVSRKWETIGGTVKETVSVNGGTWTPAGRGGNALIEALVGDPGQIVFDAQSFFALGPTERRQTLLEMVAGKDQSKIILDAEKKARADKNEAAGKTRGLVAARQQLAVKLSGRPMVNVQQLTAERAEAERLIKDLNPKVSAADKRLGSSNQKAVMRARLDAEVDKLEAQANELNAQVDKLLAESAEFSASSEKKSTELREQLEAANTALEKARMERDAELVGCFRDTLSPRDQIKLLVDIRENPKILDTLIPSHLCNRAAFDAWSTRIDILDTQVMELLDHKNDVENFIKDNDEEIATRRANYTRKTEGFQSRLNALRESLQAAIQRREELDADQTGAAVETPEEAMDRATVAAAQQKIISISTTLSSIASFDAIEKQVAELTQSIAKVEQEQDAADTQMRAMAKAQVDAIAQCVGVMNERAVPMLPLGHKIDIDDDCALVMVTPEGGRRRREALSGFQSAMFDAAVGMAMSPSGVTIIEGAELDDANLIDAIDRLSQPSSAGAANQVIIATCHKPDAVTINCNVIDCDAL